MKPLVIALILAAIGFAVAGARGAAPPSPQTDPTEPPVLLNAAKTPKGVAVTPKPSKTVPSYLATQARAGQTLFYEHCAECHGASGSGTYGPGLLHDDGNVQWQPVYYVYSYMQQHMPAGDASALKKDEYIDIMAFLLKSQGHPAGAAALSDKTLMDSAALLGMDQPK